MKLHQAFAIAPGDVVSLIGAGGKTSLLVALGYELAEAGWRVLATTTVGMDTHQLELVPHALPLSAGVEAISAALTQDRFVFIYDSIRNDRVNGIGHQQIPALLDALDSDVWLVEADTAAGLVLKAPFAHEPVIPTGTTLVVPVMSMSALSQTLDEAHVYNAQALVERYGFAHSNRIKSAWLAQILRDEELGLRGVPAKARIIPFLNQTPLKGYVRSRARLIARLALRSSRFDSVVLGDIRGAQPVHEVQRPVAAVILAAGLSTRMGQSKVMLPWSDGRMILEHIIDQLVKSRIDHIVVVTGPDRYELKRRLKSLEVDVVYNKNYKTGEMLSSIQTGLEALPSNIAGALIVPGDQPRVQPKVLYQILLAWAEGENDLLQPTFNKQPGYPVLVGRRYWGEILKSENSFQAILNEHQSTKHLVVDDDSILSDVNTPEDYQRERWRAGLK